MAIFHSTDLGSCATIHSRSTAEIIGKSVDLVGWKTRQQLVLEACEDATGKIIIKKLKEIGV